MKALQDKYIVHPNSRTKNVQYWHDKTVNKDQCELVVRDIVGLEEMPVFDNDAIAKLYFQYAVDYLWVGDFGEPEEVWKFITNKVEKLLDSMPWVGRDEEELPPESGLAPRKVQNAKKKTNQECVREWWLANLERLMGMTPKQIQEEFSTECNVHRNSARGLYYTMKKKYPISG